MTSDVRVSYFLNDFYLISSDSQDIISDFLDLGSELLMTEQTFSYQDHERNKTLSI